MSDIAMNEKKELLGFSKSMWFQCIVLYIGIWGGLLVSGYVFLLVAAYTLCIAIFGKVESLYYHLLFSIPFTVIYKLSPGSTSLFAYLMIATGIIITLRKLHIPGIVLGLFLMLSTYMIVGMGNNYTTVIKMIAGLFLLYNFVVCIKPKDFKNQIMSFSLGVLGSSLIGGMKETWDRLAIYFFDIDYVYVSGARTFRFSGLDYDPNYYAIAAIFAIFLCLRLFFNQEGNRILLAGLAIAIAFFGFISYSKMFLFAIIFLAVAFWCYRLKSSGQVVVTIIAVPIIIALFLNWADKSGYLATIQERLFGNGDISTGRFRIWKLYWSYISSSLTTLFWGDGLGARYYRFVGPHNTYIESIYFLGLLGSGLFAITISYIISCVKYVKKREFIDYILAVLFLFMIGLLGALTINNLMFYFMLLWISLNMRKEHT